MSETIPSAEELKREQQAALDRLADVIKRPLDHTLQAYTLVPVLTGQVERLLHLVGVFSQRAMDAQAAADASAHTLQEIEDTVRDDELAYETGMSECSVSYREMLIHRFFEKED